MPPLCEVGAVVAGRSVAECKAMRDYGMNLGIAFQISDDVLDYAASESASANPSAMISRKAR